MPSANVRTVSHFTLSNDPDFKGENCQITEVGQKGKKYNTIYSQYPRTTQITNLPGGLKRKDNDIYDNLHDVEYLQNQGKQSTYAKIYNDFSSKITCLPSRMTSPPQTKETGKRMHYRNNRSINSFLITPYYRGKKVDKYKQTNFESTQYDRHCGGLRISYKNQGTFQIC